METLRLLATLVPLSLAAGVNLYATVLVAGLSIRFGWVTEAPPELSVLGSVPVLLVAGVLFVLEALADKIQFVDNLWDLVHTVVRPLGAAILAIAVLGRIDPAVAVVGALLAGATALASHGAKAGGRVALNVASPAENVTNVVVSTAEDVAAGALAWFGLAHPWVALGVALVLLVLIALLLPRLLRWAFFTVRAFLSGIKALADRAMGREVASDTLPPGHMARIGHHPLEVAALCKAQGLPGAAARTGYLSLQDGRLAFTWDAWFRSRSWVTPLAAIAGVYLRPRLLTDILEIYWRDGKEREHRTRFVFLKDRAPLARRIAASLENRGAA